MNRWELLRPSILFHVTSLISASDRLTCAAASSVSEFKQWVASRVEAQAAVAASWLQCGKANSASWRLLGTRSSVSQKACCVDARKRQLDKMYKQYICMPRALRLYRQQRSQPPTHNGNSGASWFPVSNLTGQPLA